MAPSTGDPYFGPGYARWTTTGTFAGYNCTQCHSWVPSGMPHTCTSGTLTYHATWERDLGRIASALEELVHLLGDHLGESGGT